MGGWSIFRVPLMSCEDHRSPDQEHSPRASSLGWTPWSWGVAAGLLPGERDSRCPLHPVRGFWPLFGHPHLLPCLPCCRRQDTLYHGPQIHDETLSWPQVFPPSGPQQVPSSQTEGTFSSVLPSMPSLPDPVPLPPSGRFPQGAYLLPTLCFHSPGACYVSPIGLRAPQG